ncbi:mediator of rna polymerase ii transcription subunit 14-like [Plasmopara halstedii]|uniref:Mediator of RNA polymerase II transcription subunit 14 n=1 Tax=Plasmopara halstedii TaxID=4781 RepID=A0A0N7L6Y6_PLAHL|nr:mediator of rna polymerase ii transcription subunit 14-like [Plasmopara halstedii]CEG45579.1 mediator of rna polymerase ii transcription subunit 14-like [Plasmopara halstedii]|eukprot:XP_024581948.1 mediator of rna polymerase ii transcription subunit 14-like [Plasmopara halstedii]
MGDFPPLERTSVKASELVHRAVDRSYEDFRTLMHQLPTMRENDRREPLLAHIQSSRKRFAQILALLKWSVQSPLLQQCNTLLQQTELYRNNVNETNDRLFFMHADLNRAKERRYDLSTAVDVLYGQSYLRLPTIIRNAMFPREMPEVDTEEATKEVADFIRFRLIEAEIPEQFSNVKLDGGFVTCQAEGEFEIVLTIQGKDKDAKWKVIDVNTALTDTQSFEEHSRAASTSALHIIRTNAPNAAHYNHLKNLLQRVMNKSTKPFVDAFTVMREFCSSLALQILASQGKLLSEGRWKNRIMIQHLREQNALDICYWPNACVRKETQIITEQQRMLQHLSDPVATTRKGSVLPFPESSLCIRLGFDPDKKKLLSVCLSPSLPPNLPGCASLLSALEVPSNMFLLSAENLLIAGMRAHVSAALFSIGRLLVVDSPDERGVTQLVSGENVVMVCSDTSLQIARADIGGLQQFLEVTFDIREGQFIASTVAAAKSSALYVTVKQLERMLNTQCKIEVGGNVNKGIPNEFALVSGDGKGDKSGDLIHTSVRKALCEIVADEVAQIGSSFKSIDVLRNVNLSWDRYLAFRQQHGGQIEDLSISSTALYFQLTSSKESTCYLVVEIDKYGEVDGMNGNVHEAADDEEYVRLPCFSLLQTSAGMPGQPSGVQFIQRFSAFKKEALHPSVARHNEMGLAGPCGRSRKRFNASSGMFEKSTMRTSKKMKLDGGRVQEKSGYWHDGGKVQETFGYWQDGTEHQTDSRNLVPHIASVLLHAIHMCSERIQLQHFVNFARRRKSRIRYSGEAGTSNRKGTGGQVVTLSFPEKVNTDPLKIVAIQGHLKHEGGFELCLQLESPPFTFIQAQKSDKRLLSERSHYVNERGQLIFKYPTTAVTSELFSENPLEMFMVELICVVRPLCELARKLEKVLTAVGRYSNDIKSNGQFFVESADPFSIVLACRAPNPRHCIAAGSSPDGITTYRVTVHFKQKMGFVVNYSHKTEHPLMHFIQSALNGHSDPAQFVEALERTCIPMGILASVVESQLLCAKYYRQDLPLKNGAVNGDVKAFNRGKMGGKGMKLGYKFKLPGEEKDYYAEKSYGGDDKSFVPAELVMIPRSQTQVRLSYGDRCAVDIYFLENHSVRMQSSPGGVRVPSCPSEKGIVTDCQNFAEKLRSTLSEMASA